MEGLTAYLNRRIDRVLGADISEDVVVDCIFIAEDAINSIKTDGLILEAKVSFNPIPGVKHFTYRIDPQLGEGGPGRQRHIHMFYDGKEVWAMNVDGTPHDGYHQAKIDPSLNPFLTQKGFPIPSDNIIEFYQMPQGTGILLEDLDYEAINDIALNVAEVIRKAEAITIIEANVDTFQVKCNSHVAGKYTHVNQLRDVPQPQILKIKLLLIEILKEIGPYCDDGIMILDGNIKTPRRLYVAWRCKET